MGKYVNIFLSYVNICTFIFANSIHLAHSLTKNQHSMHAALPQTMTVESLAQWITENRKDTIVAKATKIITDEERSEYEHISSDCSQKLDELEEIKKEFTDKLTNGTYDPEVDDENGKIITIPATVGTKKLTEERKRVDKLLRDGHTVEKTTLYMIPWPEEKRMIAFDVEGQEWEEFSRVMREDEINQYRTLFESAPVQIDGPSDDQEDAPVMQVIEDADPFNVDGSKDEVQEELIQMPKRRGARGKTAASEGLDL
jgi:hypothetical protein